MDVYASAEDLKAALGGGDTATIEDRIATALIVATGWVGRRVGVTQTYPSATPPYDLDVIECPPAWRAATVVVAVRLYKATDIPFGVLSAGEYAVQVRARIPEAELMLVGHRLDWGIG